MPDHSFVTSNGGDEKSASPEALANEGRWPFTWKQDAWQLMTATNEGMLGKEGLQAAGPHRLGEVGRAKSNAGAKLKHKPAR
jgi:hypothetical protein